MGMIKLALLLILLISSPTWALVKCPQAPDLVCTTGSQTVVGKIYVSNAGDPADTGVLRLGDTEAICWEFSGGLAGADDACMSVSSGVFSIFGGYGFSYSGSGNGGNGAISYFGSGNGGYVAGATSGNVGGPGGDVYFISGTGGYVIGTSATAGYGGNANIQAGSGGTANGSGSVSGDGGFVQINPGGAGGTSGGATSGATGIIRIAQSVSGRTFVGSGGLRVGDDSTSAFTQKLEVLGNVLLDNGGSASELRFREPSGSGSNYTAFKAQAQSGDLTYTLPSATPGADGFFLSSTTGGSMSWSSGPGCDLSGTPTCGTGCNSITSGAKNCVGSFSTSTLVTSATLNWSGTRSAAPFCVCSDDSTASFCSVTSTSTSSVTFGLSAALTGVISYHCFLGS